MKTVYLDNAASTPIRPEVIDIMNECNKDYGNPNCVHEMGQKSRELIENSRQIIADSIGAKPNEIIFCGNGTEANNLAIQGFVNANRGGHIITSSIEHSSVLNPIKYLYHKGYDVTILPVNSDGIIDLRQLRRAIRRDTMLISIMMANNEIGSIQPIKEIGEIAKQYNICCHTDAVQAIGHCDIDVEELNIGMMSFAGHKIYAPKGIAVLYVKNDIELTPLLHGGGQEFGLRSGTENVTSIVGISKAIELLGKENKIQDLKNKLIDGIKSKISDVKFNTPVDNSLPNITNVSFEGVDGETLIKMLSEKGIYASNSTACLYSHLEPSHVLTAIGLSDELAYASIRFSFGIYNTLDDIDYILKNLVECVDKLRKGAL